MSPRIALRLRRIARARMVIPVAGVAQVGATAMLVVAAPDPARSGEVVVAVGIVISRIFAETGRQREVRPVTRRIIDSRLALPPRLLPHAVARLEIPRKLNGHFASRR